MLIPRGFEAEPEYEPPLRYFFVVFSACIHLKQLEDIISEKCTQKPINYTVRYVNGIERTAKVYISELQSPQILHCNIPEGFTGKIYAYKKRLFEFETIEHGFILQIE